MRFGNGSMHLPRRNLTVERLLVLTFTVLTKSEAMTRCYSSLHPSIDPLTSESRDRSSMNFDFAKVD